MPVYRVAPADIERSAHGLINSFGIGAEQMADELCPTIRAREAPSGARDLDGDRAGRSPDEEKPSREGPGTMNVPAPIILVDEEQRWSAAKQLMHIYGERAHRTASRRALRAASGRRDVSDLWHDIAVKIRLLEAG